MKFENDLGKDRIGPLVWKIAIPSMLAQFVSVCYSIVDRIYVGRIPDVGAVSLAGVGICGPVVTMVGSVAFLVGVGGAPMMSAQMGAGRERRAKTIVANSFLLLAVLAVLLVALILPFREPMLRLFGASGTTYAYAERYFTVYLCGTIFALMATGMNQFVICQGFAVEGMKAVMLGAVTNIILDPIFIFVFHMGVGGAAAATVLSQMASASYVLCFLFGKRTKIKITFRGYNLRLMAKILGKGMTPFLIIAADNVMIIAMNAVLQRYGGPEQGDALITCNAIVQSFMLAMTMPLGGISAGTQSILAFNFGAGRPDRVERAQKYIMAMCAGFTAIMFLMARVGGQAFVSLFTEDPELAAMACRAIRICTLAAIPLGVQYAIVDGFTGLGLVSLALPLSAWRKVVYFAAVFILPGIWGAENVFYAQPISDVIGPFTSIAVFLLLNKKVLAAAGKI